MILTVRDERDRNLSMKLDINYELERIEVVVADWDKAAHTVDTKRFEASEFAAARAYFRQQEAFLSGKKED